MPEFDPYEHLLQNFSKYKFKLFIERSLLDLKSYQKPSDPYSELWKVEKDTWVDSDSAYIDIPNEGGILGSTSYSRWLFYLDHVENDLILPGMVWKRAQQDVKKLASNIASDKAYLRTLKEKLYDRYGKESCEVVLEKGKHVLLHCPTHGHLTIYYLTNVNFDPENNVQDFKGFTNALSADIRATFIDSSKQFGIDLAEANFNCGIGTPRTFLRGNKDNAIKAIKEIEARPDSIQIQFVENRIQVIPSNKRKLFAYDSKKPRLVTLDQVIDSTSFFCENEIEEFENLLNKPSLREEEIQKFLTKRPKFLFSLDYDEIKPQVSLIDDSGSELIPDFFLKPVGKAYWDILDIKLPDVQLISGSLNRKGLSHYVHRGNAQLMNYAKFFDDPKNKEKMVKLTGIRCFKPRLTLVIGKKKNIDEECWNQIIAQERPIVNILGFDELIERAKRNIVNFAKLP
jgi:hypothetical protein